MAPSFRLVLVSTSLLNTFIPFPLIGIRKDRYDKKLRKYYVVYEEGDEELSEDEERNEQRDVEAPHLHIVNANQGKPPRSTPAPEVADDNVSFKRLGVKAAISDVESDASEKEEKAKKVNTPKEDYRPICMFKVE